MSRLVDIQDFARRVERLCEFLENQAERDGSDDIVIIQKLKDDALDIQNANLTTEAISGLADFMKGVVHEPRPSGARTDARP